MLLLALLAYLGGVLTIVSPCILPPGASHGSDIDANGDGTVTGQRLYQLVRQNSDSMDGGVADRTFEIRFLDPGVQAYAFTFG